MVGSLIGSAHLNLGLRYLYLKKIPEFALTANARSSPIPALACFAAKRQKLRPLRVGSSFPQSALRWRFAGALRAFARVPARPLGRAVAEGD